MHTEKREDPTPGVNYELRDINLAAIRNATIVFFAFALGAGVIGYFFFRWMNPGAFRQDQPSAMSRERQLPAKPNPLLQDNVTVRTDTMLLRQQEEKLLHGAPSRNKDGSYRIPIEAAIAIIAEQGAKTQAAPAAETARPATPAPAQPQAGDAAAPTSAATPGGAQ